MIDEVGDVFGWERKHTIQALNVQVSLGSRANKRRSKGRYGVAEVEVIVAIWKLAEQPCGVRLKATLPEWLVSYQKHYDKLVKAFRDRIIGHRTTPFRPPPLRSKGGFKSLPLKANS